MSSKLNPEMLATVREGLMQKMSEDTLNVVDTIGQDTLNAFLDRILDALEVVSFGL